MSDVELQQQRPEQRRRARPAPSPDALTYSISDALSMTGFGRTMLYELMNSGRLRFIKIDGRRKVIGESLRALLGL